MGRRKMVKRFIKRGGNCFDCICTGCPLDGQCVEGDTDDRTLELAKKWLAEHPKKQKGDAHLIASAPDLYQALKFTRRFIKDGSPDAEYIDSVLNKVVPL